MASPPNVAFYERKLTVPSRSIRLERYVVASEVIIFLHDLLINSLVAPRSVPLQSRGRRYGHVVVNLEGQGRTSATVPLPPPTLTPAPNLTPSRYARLRSSQGGLW